jgi:hypothetical protein
LKLPITSNKKNAPAVVSAGANGRSVARLCGQTALYPKPALVKRCRLFALLKAYPLDSFAVPSKPDSPISAEIVSDGIPNSDAVSLVKTTKGVKVLTPPKKNLLRQII